MASDGWRAQGPRAKSSRLRTVPSKSLRPEDSVTKSTFNVINQKNKTGDGLKDIKVFHVLSCLQEITSEDKT